MTVTEEEKQNPYIKLQQCLEWVIGNESVPKIIIIDTINLFLTAISILVTSNHDSFRVLFDKIASVYFIRKT